MALQSNADVCLLNGLLPVISDFFAFRTVLKVASELTTLPLNLHDQAWLANKEQCVS